MIPKDIREFKNELDKFTDLVVNVLWFMDEKGLMKEFKQWCEEKGVDCE